MCKIAAIACLVVAVSAFPAPQFNDNFFQSQKSTFGDFGNFPGLQPFKVGNTQTLTQTQFQQQGKGAGVQELELSRGNADVQSNSESFSEDGKARGKSEAQAIAEGFDIKNKLTDQSNAVVQGQTSTKTESIGGGPGGNAGIRRQQQGQNQFSASGNVVNQGSVGEGRFKASTNTDSVAESGKSGQRTGARTQAAGTGIRIVSGNTAQAKGQTQNTIAEQSKFNFN